MLGVPRVLGTPRRRGAVASHSPVSRTLPRGLPGVRWSGETVLTLERGSGPAVGSGTSVLPRVTASQPLALLVPQPSRVTWPRAAPKGAGKGCPAMFPGGPGAPATPRAPLSPHLREHAAAREPSLHPEATPQPVGRVADTRAVHAVGPRRTAWQRRLNA